MWTREIYVWSEQFGTTDPGSPPVGDFVKFYNSVEDGFLAFVWDHHTSNALTRTCAPILPARSLEWEERRDKFISIGVVVRKKLLDLKGYK